MFFMGSYGFKEFRHEMDKISPIALNRCAIQFIYDKRLKRRIV